MIHKKVRFKGTEYWLHQGDIPGCQNLSPLSHYSENGSLIADAFTDISFAIVIDGEIMQYGVSIGKASELEDVK